MDLASRMMVFRRRRWPIRCPSTKSAVLYRNSWQNRVGKNIKTCPLPSKLESLLSNPKIPKNKWGDLAPVTNPFQTDNSGQFVGIFLTKSLRSGAHVQIETAGQHGQPQHSETEEQIGGGVLVLLVCFCYI